MANPDTPRGLRPVRRLDGAVWNGQTFRMYIPVGYSTALFIGDAVVWNGEANAAGTEPVAIIATVAATNRITGVITSFDPLPDNLSKIYNPAYTERYCNVCLPYGMIFEIQADSVQAVPVTAVGLNANLIYTHAGSTGSGLSGAELNSSTVTADATFQMTILGLSGTMNNDPTLVNSKWLVSINLPSPFPGIAGV